MGGGRVTDRWCCVWINEPRDYRQSQHENARIFLGLQNVNVAETFHCGLFEEVSEASVRFGIVPPIQADFAHRFVKQAPGICKLTWLKIARLRF